MNDASGLQSEVISLGRLVGLLAQATDAVTVNTGWFSDPVGSLKQIGTRLDSLASLLEEILGPGSADAPTVFADARWYPLPDPTSGLVTPFCVVAAAPADAAGQIGLGVQSAIQLGGLTITAFLYLPLLGYSPSGTQFIADSTEFPCQIGLDVTTSDPDGFQVDGVSFTAMEIAAKIYLADQAPGFSMTFENLKGTPAPSTYTSLSSLLDPTVESWIGEVIVQGSDWLNLLVGNSPTTVGDILKAAGFLTQDDHGAYQLSLTNLQGTSAGQIALNFVFAALDALANLDVPLINLPGGGVYIAADSVGSGKSYGIRFAGDLSITPSPSTDGSAPPAIDISLGTWFPGESDASNWISQITGTAMPAGLSIFALNRDAGGNLSFAPSFELTSAGLGISGGGDAPLINLGGYTLKGADPGQPQLHEFGLDLRLRRPARHRRLPVGPELQRRATARRGLQRGGPEPALLQLAGRCPGRGQRRQPGLLGGGGLHPRE